MSRNLFALAAFCALQACSYEPPRAISIDPRFSPTEQAAIRDAIDQWCAADGWCPEVGVGQEAQGHIWRDDAEQFARVMDQPDVGGHTDEDTKTIHVNSDVIDGWPEMTWLIVAHELGHLHGVDHHGGPECTMFWEHSEPTYQLTCE